MTMPTRYIRGPDGQLVAAPGLEPVEEEEVEEEEVEEEDDTADLFEGVEGNQGEQYLTEEDEDDLFGVSEPRDEIEPQKPSKPKIRRTIKRYPSPPTTLGGMRG